MMGLSVSMVMAGLIEGSPPKHSKIAAQSQVLWATADGRVLASGAAESPRGDDAEKSRRYFGPIVGLEGIVAVALARGEEGAAAIDGEGRVWLWGSLWCPHVRPYMDCEEQSHRPGLLTKLDDRVVQIAAGGGHLVLLGGDGRVRTLGGDRWDGANGFGQLGTGSTDPVATITVVPGIDDAVAVAAGEQTTLILRRGGSVWGLGNSWGGLLGSAAREESSLLSGITEASANPELVRIRGLSGIRSIACGERFAVALDRSGRVWGWGINDSGQLGLPAQDLVVFRPHPLEGLEGIVAVAAGYDFLLALRRDGTVLAQGGNVYGTLGDLQGELEGALRALPELGTVTAIYAGHYNAFARLSDGRFVGWGTNSPELGGFRPAADHGAILPAELDPGLREPPPDPVVADGGAAVRVWRSLPDGQVAEDLELRLGGWSSWTVQLDRSKPEGEVQLGLPLGIHRYTIQGAAYGEDGARPVVGSGTVVVRTEKIRTWFEDVARTRSITEALRALRSELAETDPDGPSKLFHLSAEAPLEERALRSVEAALGFPLPAPYRKLLMREGPFRFGGDSALHPDVALFPPRPAATLDAWLLEREGAQKQSTDRTEAGIAWGLDDYGQHITDSLRREWRRERVGASVGHNLYTFAGPGDDAPRNEGPRSKGPMSRWLDFFAELGGEVPADAVVADTDHETEIFEVLLEGVCDLLEEIFRESEHVFLIAHPDGTENHLSLEARGGDGKSLDLRLHGDHGWRSW